jgi:ATP-dependent RNA helicase DDX24/MAK5
MSLLKLPVHLLHAKMQQRQRLKNLDHFKASKNGILICTDVAARGLDIPQVQQVVHYELPTSSEVYVHRSGRTARAGENGFCLSLVGTKELITYKNLCASLGYSDIPSFRVLMKIYKKIQPLVRSCIEVEKLMNQDRKASMNDNWFVKSAQDLDIELDEVVLDNIKKHKKDEDDLNAQNSHDNKLKKMKNKFSMLLSEFDSFKTRMAKEVPSLNV